MKRYIYPKLPAAYTTPFFRIGGNGLANCLFVYAKAIILAHKYDAELIAPTWFNFSIGTYLRKQIDKRHYLGIILKKGEISGLKRLGLLIFFKKTANEQLYQEENKKILVVEGIYDFFRPLLQYQNLIKNYLFGHINPNILKDVNSFDFSDCVAVHVRLGDFPLDRRVPMKWYVEQIKRHNLKKILLFSDGTDDELKDLMALEGVERKYFGGAIQDIIAISRCSYLIGSDSSFSAWGAYLGQVPCIFYRLQFGIVLLNKELQIIEH